MTIERSTHSEAETIDLARALAGRLTGGEVICLEGELGSGKTCFVRGLAAGLGLDPSAVCSPTFVIWRQYDDHAPLKLVHVDAFRLTGAQDLESIGWDELLTARDVVIAVEWPSRIETALPPNRIDVRLEHTGDTSRRLTLSAPDELVESWAAGVVMDD